MVESGENVDTSRINDLVTDPSPAKTGTGMSRIKIWSPVPVPVTPVPAIPHGFTFPCPSLPLEGDPVSVDFKGAEPASQISSAKDKVRPHQTRLRRKVTGSWMLSGNRRSSKLQKGWQQLWSLNLMRNRFRPRLIRLRGRLIGFPKSQCHTHVCVSQKLESSQLLHSQIIYIKYSNLQNLLKLTKQQ